MRAVGRRCQRPYAYQPALAGSRRYRNKTGAWMNEPSLIREARPEIDDPNLPTGVGATLRRLREAKPLTPGEVSARRKFSNRQLEALATKQWDLLPGGMSLRCFFQNNGP